MIARRASEPERGGEGKTGSVSCVFFPFSPTPSPLLAPFSLEAFLRQVSGKSLKNLIPEVPIVKILRGEKRGERGERERERERMQKETFRWVEGTCLQVLQCLCLFSHSVVHRCSSCTTDMASISSSSLRCQSLHHRICRHSSQIQPTIGRPSSFLFRGVAGGAELSEAMGHADDEERCQSCLL